MVGCYGPLTPEELSDLLATGQYALVGGPYSSEEECQLNCGQSGSGSGSGGSGSGIDEGCPCDPLPTSLLLTLSARPSCDAWDGLTAVLNYNPISGDWVGTVINPINGSTMTFIFSCTSGGIYLMTCISSAGIGAVDFALDVINCDPLELSASAELAGGSAFACAGTIVFTVTNI